MSTIIEVVVFRGFPFADENTDRHTALFLVFPNGSMTMMEIIGGTGAWTFRSPEGFNPYHSEKFLGSVPVAVIPGEGLVPRILYAIESTAIPNRDPGFNCQLWTGEALNQLIREGFVPQVEKDRILSGMVDLIIS